MKMVLFDMFFPKKEGHSERMEFTFHSADHIRYQHGVHVSGPHGGAARVIMVEPNIHGGEGYTVTIFNPAPGHPIGQGNVQMAPKQMKILSRSEDNVVLRGCGMDAMGESFANYGMTVYFDNGAVHRCILHLHDRNVDIEYHKDDPMHEEPSAEHDNQAVADDLAEIKAFIHKWTNEISFIASQQNARDTDRLNNIGCDYYNEDDYENAIKYFQMALVVMPINDDALRNLVICYRVLQDPLKMQEMQRKLDYVQASGL